MDESIKAWSGAQDVVKHDGEMSHPRDGYAMLVFADAFNEFCKCRIWWMKGSWWKI